MKNTNTKTAILDVRPYQDSYGTESPEVSAICADGHQTKSISSNFKLTPGMGVEEIFGNLLNDKTINETAQKLCANHPASDHWWEHIKSWIPLVDSTVDEVPNIDSSHAVITKTHVDNSDYAQGKVEGVPAKSLLARMEQAHTFITAKCSNGADVSGVDSDIFFTNSSAGELVAEELPSANKACGRSR